MKFGILISIAVAFTCCTRQPELAMNDDIILVNAGHKDRKELSLAIDRLARCNPTIVGINFLFRGRQQMSDDTLLANSIKRAGNIVLASALRDGKIISSDSLFTTSALAEGLIYYGLDGGSVSKQMMYISVGVDLVWSFPTTLASYFDFDKSDHIMKSVRGNRFYEIEIISE